MKLHVNGEVVAHSGHLDKARVTGVGGIDDFRDGRTVRAAHDGVAGAVNHEDRRFDLLPKLAEIQRLKLLVKRHWPAVLTVGLVVPQWFPFRVLAKNFAGSLAVRPQELAATNPATW